MTKTEGNILKSNQVKVEGRFLLDAAPPNRTAKPHRSTNHAPPQVRIAESHPEYAVLELTCSCGNKSYIRCQYDNAESTDAETQQN